MSIKSFFGKILAKRDVSQTKKWSSKPVETQRKVMLQLLNTAAHTAFGKDHGFSKINNYEDFKNQVPGRIDPSCNSPSP